MKPIGPKWASDATAAGLVGHQAGSDGLIEVHDQQNRLVKIWMDDAGVVQESRTADLGTHPQLTEPQIAAIKTCRASHNHTVLTEDVPGFRAWLKSAMSFALRNNVMKAYPNFLVDLTAKDWADFQAGCLAANAAIPLTAPQWTAFKSAVTTYRIPITLP